MWTEKPKHRETSGGSAARPPDWASKRSEPFTLSLLLISIVAYVYVLYDYVHGGACSCLSVRSHLSSSVFSPDLPSDPICYFWPVDEVILLSYRWDCGRRSTFGSTFHTSCQGLYLFILKAIHRPTPAHIWSYPTTPSQYKTLYLQSWCCVDILFMDLLLMGERVHLLI